MHDTIAPAAAAENELEALLREAATELHSLTGDLEPLMEVCCHIEG